MPFSYKGENTRDDTDGTESIWGQQEEKHKSVWMDVCGAMRPQVVTEEEVTEQLSGAKMRALQKNSGKLEVWGTCKFQQSCRTFHGTHLHVQPSRMDGNLQKGPGGR